MTATTATDRVRSIVENMRRAGDEWVAMSMVLEFRDGSLCGTYGYVYSLSGSATATSVRPPDRRRLREGVSRSTTATASTGRTC